MQIKHVCQSCGDELPGSEGLPARIRALCDACRLYPGCPLPSEGTRGQEVGANGNGALRNVRSAINY
jgi:hypothetical protein